MIRSFLTAIAQILLAILIFSLLYYGLEFIAVGAILDFIGATLIAFSVKGIFTATRILKPLYKYVDIQHNTKIKDNLSNVEEPKSLVSNFIETFERNSIIDNIISLATAVSPIICVLVADTLIRDLPSNPDLTTLILLTSLLTFPFILLVESIVGINGLAKDKKQTDLQAKDSIHKEIPSETIKTNKEGGFFK